MARGMAAGEPIVSQAQNKAFDEGAERMGLGTSASAKERGRFVWDPKQNKLVRPWEVEREEENFAKDAPVLVGRFYEGVPSPLGDGVVFQSRAQHRAYMREKGLTTIDDYNAPGGAWDRAEAKRKEGFASPEHRRDRQERIGRRLYEVEKMPQAKYDRVVREVAERRARRGQGTPTE